MIFSTIVSEQNKGNPKGITSICSANKFVIESSLIFAKKQGTSVLVEATSNQVDQYGGYTGMTPDQFKNYVYDISASVDFPTDKIILGGDHLGPNVWQNESSESAMKKAEEQIAEYVKAGFTKIHLDTSFSLADDDKSKPLSPHIITERAAHLCKVAEETYSDINDEIEKPVYVIGTEVPIPGGAQEEEETISVTTRDDLEVTIELSKKAFFKRDLQGAWERVIAVVVQPGVEFSDTQVIKYNRDNVSKLKNEIEKYPNLVFEAHSTDYQSKLALTEMVEDHFGILKVGPWLTYAAREAIFALSDIENELVASEKSSNLRDEIDDVMVENPKYWERHYHGTQQEINLARAYSYSDRIRYYWTDKKVITLLDKMMSNLNEIVIPTTLISQYLPNQYHLIVENKIENNPESLIINKVSEVLNIYNSACGGISEE
jgi:D-tagatose-1,6-bisphosphate aldolase subunit GatZ/KbaZ